MDFITIFIEEYALKKNPLHTAQTAFMLHNVPIKICIGASILVLNKPTKRVTPSNGAKNS